MPSPEKIQELQNAFDTELKENPNRLVGGIIQLAGAQPAPLEALIHTLENDRTKDFLKPNPAPNANQNQNQNENDRKSAQLIHCLKIASQQQIIQAQAQQQAINEGKNEDELVFEDKQLEKKSKEEESEGEFKPPEEDSLFLQKLNEELQEDENTKKLADKLESELSNHRIYSGSSSSRKADQQLGHLMEVEFGPGDPLYKVAGALADYFNETKGRVDYEARDAEKRETNRRALGMSMKPSGPG